MKCLSKKDRKSATSLSVCMSSCWNPSLFILQLLLSPHLLVDHLSTASVQSAAEKERKTYSRLMGRGEHSYLAGNPPPSSFVKGTHLKEGCSNYGLVYFSLFQRDLNWGKSPYRLSLVVDRSISIKGSSAALGIVGHWNAPWYNRFFKAWNCFYHKMETERKM